MDIISSLRQTITQLQEKKALQEQPLQELSKKTLGSYINKATDDGNFKAFQQGKFYGKELVTKKKSESEKATSRSLSNHVDKRKAGIRKATDRLTNTFAGRNSTYDHKGFRYGEAKSKVNEEPRTFSKREWRKYISDLKSEKPVESSEKRARNRDLIIAKRNRGIDANKRLKEESLNEVAIGSRVRLDYSKSGRTKDPFHGKTGTVTDHEKDGKMKLHRVHLDEPVDYPGVGKVKHDLWSSEYLKKIK